MRHREMMTAAAVTIAGLGVLVGVAIGSAGTTPKPGSVGAPPVEVRTEVIRKTVQVYRRAKPTRPSGGSGAAGGPVGSPRGSAATAVIPARSRASGTAAAPTGPVTPAVKTRTSGGAGSRPLSTKSSGGGGDGGGGHDD